VCDHSPAAPARAAVSGRALICGNDSVFFRLASNPVPYETTTTGQGAIMSYEMLVIGAAILAAVIVLGARGSYQRGFAAGRGRKRDAVPR
jgi:hypothetical protein